MKWTAPFPWVLPTRVGMVRCFCWTADTWLGSPHPRGDGPVGRVAVSSEAEFSPPAWGWSAANSTMERFGTVLPTRVGMVRAVRPSVVGAVSSPHPRGDGPRKTPSPRLKRAFSPPAWGWSAVAAVEGQRRPVLPTRVGMVRSLIPEAPGPPRSPHPRGDGPKQMLMVREFNAFSPPAWGWSANPSPVDLAHHVLPTRVGMVRGKAGLGSGGGCSPHPRGDGPRTRTRNLNLIRFSPPAWGWSATGSEQLCASDVLPTRVGMVRDQIRPRPPHLRSPHPRGDGPIALNVPSDARQFSPPAWGWSEMRPAT